jgi:threonyl-tRNA synthetase
MDLWVQSGHAANYKDDMFVLEVYIYIYIFFLFACVFLEE